MQLSMMYRRGIVMPLDHSAWTELEHDDVREATPVHWLKIDSKELFHKLERSGLFDELALACSVRIAPREPAELLPVALPRALAIVRQHIARLPMSRLRAAFLRNFESLLQTAISNGYPLFIVL